MCLYCIIYKYIIQYIGCYIKHYLQKIPRNQWFPSMFCSLQNSVLRNNYRELQINRVGYQIWFFGWNNDYMNIPWANTDFATYFILSGYGDYPDFTWK